MSVVLDPKQTFLGVPLLKVRNVLRAWRYGRSEDAHDIAVRKDVQLHPCTVMILLEELRDRGLIGLEDDGEDRSFEGLTDPGLALASAIARKRTPKPQAQLVLTRFLDACAAVNARNDVPICVHEVWLYGSMVDPSRHDVADIDVVLIAGRPQRFQNNWRKRYEQLAETIGGEQILESRRWYFSWAENYVNNHLLHGGRRHPLLSFGSLQTLKDLACPCQLVFDATQGGKIDAPVLDRHPASSGRSNTIRDKLYLPDLSAVRPPLRPVSANLSQPGEFHWKTMVASGCWHPQDRRYDIVSREKARMMVIGNEAGRDVKRNVVMRRLDFSGCDGREKTGLIACNLDKSDCLNWVRVPALGLILRRTIIEDDPAHVCLQLQFLAGTQLGRYPDYWQVIAMTWWLQVLIAADIERIMRRDQEQGRRRAVRIRPEDVAGNMATTTIAETLVDDDLQQLMHRVWLRINNGGEEQHPDAKQHPGARMHAAPTFLWSVSFRRYWPCLHRCAAR